MYITAPRQTRASGDVVYVDLDNDERAVLARLARKVAAKVALAPESLALCTATAARSLAPSVIELGGHVRSRPPGCPGWLLRGLPIDESELGPTPASWSERSDDVTPEECVLLLVAHAFGNVFAWADQQGGATVHDIVPAAGEEDSLLSSSSTREMSLHTEDAFFPERADLILLLCLRNPSHAPTYISAIHNVVISEELAALARSRRYLFTPDDSHTGRDPECSSRGFPVVRGDLRRREGLSPLITGTGSDLQIRFDSDYIDTPGDETAANAVKALDRALYRARTEIVLGPGELLIIDNKRCVHGRGRFQAALDGRDRWLKRVNVSTSKGSAQANRNRELVDKRSSYQ